MNKYNIILKNENGFLFLGKYPSATIGYGSLAT